jgi:hypothetical protein
VISGFRILTLTLTPTLRVWVRVRVRVRVGGQNYIVNTPHGYFRKDNLDIWRNKMGKASTKVNSSNADSKPSSAKSSSGVSHLSSSSTSGIAS